MSGHSKWSQIKRQKGAADVKRGALFSRLANAIILLARNGGDPNTNFSLKMAIEKARAANMPKENIERAIKRGTGEIAGAKIEEIIYEVIGPVGIGIVIETATDNRNRTNSEIKIALGKFGAKLVGSGAVTYQFEQMGKLVIDLTSQNRDEMELIMIDAGAEDFEEYDKTLVVYTKPAELEMIKKVVERESITVKDATLVWEPKNLVNISDQSQAQKILTLMETLENLEDVVAVYSNFDIIPTLITNSN